MPPNWSDKLFLTNDSLSYRVECFGKVKHTSHFTIKGLNSSGFGFHTFSWTFLMMSQPSERGERSRAIEDWDRAKEVTLAIGRQGQNTPKSWCRLPFLIYAYKAPTFKLDFFQSHLGVLDSQFLLILTGCSNFVCSFEKLSLNYYSVLSADNPLSSCTVHNTKVRPCPEEIRV